MATYLELFTLFNDSELKNKITVAVSVEAAAIRDELPTTPNHANRLKWAKRALENADGEVEGMLKHLLSINKDADIATIQAASDATIQSGVSNAVDIFADGS